MIRILSLLVLLEVSVSAYAQESRHIRLAFVGDSITSGAYPRELHGLLGKESSLLIYAKSGGKIEELFEAVKSILDGPYHPTHIVFYGGINDCIGKGLSGSAYVIDMLDKIVKNIHKYRVSVIVLEHHPWHGYAFEGWGCSCLVNDWLGMKGFSSVEIQVVDTSKLGKRGILDSKYDSGDGLHLNYNGQIRLANLIFEQVKF